ncbi:MAG: ABC transporter substrate-binding protein [Beijerinckiaceae bacterium]
MKNQALQVVACAALVCLTISSAQAQKSADTLRMTLNDPIQGISYYLDPKTETIFTSEMVYDCLIGYDEDTQKFQPLLAKSWKRIGETVLEFDLRDDVKWHDGKPFSAEDVVYTMNWLTDPKTPLRFKSYWAWIAKTEALGPHKVRITAKSPTPYDMARLAYLTVILPKHAHGVAKEKMAFSRKPIGTGMYKAVSVDAGRGIVMVRNTDYRHGGDVKPPSNIGKVVLRQIPEPGTRVAEFLAGQIDLLPRDTPLDQVEAMDTMPGVVVTAGQSTYYKYVAINATGRSGLKPLEDIRVRKAIFMAINRDGLAEIAIGKLKNIARPESMCWRSQAGCDYSVPLPKYDPAGAKKLLAEAGYPNGFDLTVTTFTNEGIRSVAEAITGQLRKVGIRASLEPMTLGAYRKKQGAGKLQIFAGGWPGGGMPDVTGTVRFFYNASPKIAYHNDKELKQLSIDVDRTMDETKRKEIGRKLFDMGLERGYFMPTAPGPAVIIHREELKVKAGTMRGLNIDMSNVNWK